MKLLLIIIIALLAGLAIYIAVLYNRLVKKRNESQNAFAQIDVQLARRADLIPNIAAAAKRYLAHEKDVLAAAAALRAAGSGSAQDPGARVLAENKLLRTFALFQARFEAYPELKADAQIQALQEELKSTENRVAFARQYFNDAATDYNTALEQFPQNIIAKCFGFSPHQLLLLITAQEISHG